MTTIDKLEGLLAEMRAADAVGDAGELVWTGQRLANEMRVLVPLLRTLVDADTAWTEAVVGASAISFEECTRRAGVADDAVQALLAALRGTP